MPYSDPMTSFAETFDEWFESTDFARGVDLRDPATARHVFENVWITALEIESGGDMWLCESRSLCLRPGLFYRFKVDPACEKCVKYAEEAKI